MPGTNLTRDEAQTRAGLLTSTSYTIDLDLTISDKVLRDHHRDHVHLLASPARPPSPTWSAPPSTRSRSTASRSTRSTSTPTAGSALTTCQADNELRVVAATALQPHRRGPAPLRRPRRRRVYLYTPVRGARRPPRVHHVRAARPQGGLHLQRDRAGALAGRLQRPDARAGGRLDDGTVGVALPRPPSRCRPTSPRWSPVSTTWSATPTRASTARSRSATSAASRWSSTSTPTRSSRSPSRASSSSRTPSTWRTRSRSTTSSSCRSTTWARWRTPAA